MCDTAWTGVEFASDFGGTVEQQHNHRFMAIIQVNLC